MKRCLIVLVLLLTASAVPALGAESAPVKRCAAVEDIGPTGSNPADGVAVRARGVTCRRARRVVKAYFPALFEAGVVDDSFPWRRWTCYDPGLVCKASGGKRVRFKIGEK